MLDQVTAATLAAEVKMVRAAFSGTVLLLEGSSDYKFFETLLDLDNCQRINSHGKENALGCIDRLGSENAIQGVLAFVDADFGWIDNELPDSPHVVVSDYHDIEMMMLLSPALGKLLREFASPAKLRRVDGEGLSGVADLILREAGKIAHLRHYSMRNSWNLKFRDLDHSKFTQSKDGLSVDRQKLASVVLSSGGPAGVTVESATQIIPENPDQDLKQLCCGHDCCALLALGLRQHLGSQPATVATRENVEKLLRIGYENAYWSTTQAFRAFRKWERENAPYRLMRSNGSTADDPDAEIGVPDDLASQDADAESGAEAESLDADA